MGNITPKLGCHIARDGAPRHRESADLPGPARSPVAHDAADLVGRTLLSASFGAAVPPEGPWQVTVRSAMTGGQECPPYQIQTGRRLFGCPAAQNSSLARDATPRA